MTSPHYDVLHKQTKYFLKSHDTHYLLSKLMQMSRSADSRRRADADTVTLSSHQELHAHTCQRISSPLGLDGHWTFLYTFLQTNALHFKKCNFAEFSNSDLNINTFLCLLAPAIISFTEENDNVLKLLARG